jgi:hypothetical protein
MIVDLRRQQPRFDDGSLDGCRLIAMPLNRKPDADQRRERNDSSEYKPRQA